MDVGAARKHRAARPAVGLVCQVVALDKAYFDPIVGTLSRRSRKALDAGLKLVLDLT